MAASRIATRSTVQYLTVFDGPSTSKSNPAYSLEYLGRLNHPYGTAHFRGNRFDLVIRDFSGELAADALGLVRSLGSDGLPNYFDDQRFGSVGPSGEFIAHAWLEGDAEQALKLALAEAHPADRSAVKAEKGILRECWGRWPDGEKPARSLFGPKYRDVPGRSPDRFSRGLRTDAPRAADLVFLRVSKPSVELDPGALLERSTRPEQRMTVHLKAGPLPFPRCLEPEQAKALIDWPIPLPSSRNALPDGPPREMIECVLADFQLTWRDLRVRHLKDVFFSKGSRPALVFPENLKASVSDDAMHRGKQALTVSFELGKGSYATILVKRITAAVQPS